MFQINRIKKSEKRKFQVTFNIHHMNLVLVKLGQYQESGYGNGEQGMDLRDTGRLNRKI